MHLWWGGGGEDQVHNVAYDPVMTPWRAEKEQERERRCLHYKSPDGTDTSSVM